MKSVKIILKSKHLNQIRQIAERAYPHECCGFMVASLDKQAKAVERVIPAENQHTDSPTNRYLITPDQVYRVERQLRGTSHQLVGFFHSHPDVSAQPSEYDRKHAWPWYSYLIVSVRRGRAREVNTWKLRDDRSAFDPEQLEVV